jgi:hypothetical protein
MAIRAVVFDIGGVLEITPDLGITQLWETRLGLPAGELNQRMHDAWAGGSIGTITEVEVHQAITDRLGLAGQQLAAFMADIWREYLGTANTGLIEYARRLRPRYRTGILSNSFVSSERLRRAGLLPGPLAGNHRRAVDAADRPRRLLGGAPVRGLHRPSAHAAGGAGQQAEDPDRGRRDDAGRRRASPRI